MKPLTIEELKALEVGDWVWVKFKTTDPDKRYANQERYFQIIEAENDTAIRFNKYVPMQYFEYGKTWLAYKNKEQAEAKGEIVELPNPIMRGDSTLGYAIDYYVTKTEYFKDKEEAERRLAELKGE